MGNKLRFEALPAPAAATSAVDVAAEHGGHQAAVDLHMRRPANNNRILIFGYKILNLVVWCEREGERIRFRYALLLFYSHAAVFYLMKNGTIVCGCLGPKITICCWCIPFLNIACISLL